MKSRSEFWLLVGSLAGVIFLWGGYLALARCVFNEQDALVKNDFGAVNALFSGLAFAVIFVTLKIQNQQRLDEKKRSDFVYVQDLFFKLLSMYGDILEDLPYGGNDKQVGPGRSALSAMVGDFIVNVRFVTNFEGVNPEQHADIIRTDFERMYSEHARSFQRLFGVVVYAVELLDGEEVEEKEKARLLRVMLSGFTEDEKVAFVGYVVFVLNNSIVCRLFGECILKPGESMDDWMAQAINRA